MLERTLIPLDGSPQAEAILPPLYPIFYRARSQVLLMHSIEPPARASIATRARREADRYLRGVADRLAERGIDAHALIRIGSPVRAILDTAREEDVKLIALSSRGRETPEEYTLGPVTQRLFDESVCPIAAMNPILPSPGDPPSEAGLLSYESILVPMDGSAGSRAALPLARELGQVLGARLELLRVLERVEESERSVPPEDAPQEVEPVDGESLDERRAWRELKDLAGRLSSLGIPTVSILEKGEPAESILSVARAHGVNLIVMATRAPTGISKILLGSVASRVMREARVPVLAVSSAQEARPPESLPIPA